MTVAGLIGIVIGGVAAITLLVVLITYVAKATSRAIDRRNP